MSVYAVKISAFVREVTSLYIEGKCVFSFSLVSAGCSTVHLNIVHKYRVNATQIINLVIKSGKMKYLYPYEQKSDVLL